MSALITFRSLTYAQRGLLTLGRSGIPGRIVSVPRGLSDRGCAYAVSFSDHRWENAAEVLDTAGADYGKVFLREADGSYRQVRP